MPVIVHVIFNTEEQKITSEQVASQISALNRDFNLQNKDNEDVPLRWEGKIGNPNITFFLTRRDEQGKPHSGINPVKTDVKMFPENDEGMKFSPKGAPAWDRDRFLNIWVCNMDKNLGFAWYPNAKIDKGQDGVVIQYDAFGTIQPAGKQLQSKYNLGRTLVHEVGHYLNLPHVFDDDAGQVKDTTNLPGSISNRGKPLYPKLSSFKDGRSATNKEKGGDMFMNYMDYCDDDVTVMFTKLQVSRMRAALTTYRSTVFWSNFSLQLKSQKTSFELADRKTKFNVLDWNDKDKKFLIAIKAPTSHDETIDIQLAGGTGGLTSKAEVFKVKTPEGRPDDYTYALGRQGDEHLFVALKTTGTTEKKVEIQAYAMQPTIQQRFTRVTALPETDGKWSFIIANWNTKKPHAMDLVAIKKSQTTNKKVEIHVLGAKSAYQAESDYLYRDWLAHKYTALDETSDPVIFLLTDWNGDGYIDLVAIKKASDGSGFFIDILAGAADYRDFLVRAEIKSTTLDTKVDYDFALTD